MSTLLLLREEQENQIDKITRFKDFSGNTVTCPLITFSYDFSFTAEKIEKINHTPWLFFTSQHGVVGFFSTLNNYLTKVEIKELLKNKKFAVVGKKTGTILKNYGYEADFMPTRATKEDLKKEWEHFFTGKKIWFMGNLAQEKNDTFNTFWVVYNNCCPKGSLEKLDKLLTENITHCFITSPSIWERFYEVYQKKQFPITFYCLGKTTKRAMLTDLPTLLIQEIK